MMQDFDYNGAMRASADEAPAWLSQSGWKERLRKDAQIDEDKINSKPPIISNFTT